MYYCYDKLLRLGRNVKMTMNSDYKHIAAVKLIPSSKISSVTPQKTLVAKELYYQNRAENDYRGEISASYCNFDDERPAC
jgi:hypothetical protein